MDKKDLIESMDYFRDQYGRLDGFAGDEKAEKVFPKIYSMRNQYKELKESITKEIRNTRLES